MKYVFSEPISDETLEERLFRLQVEIYDLDRKIYHETPRPLRWLVRLILKVKKEDM